jgi:hypothetical protein
MVPGAADMAGDAAASLKQAGKDAMGDMEGQLRTKMADN